MKFLKNIMSISFRNFLTITFFFLCLSINGFYAQSKLQKSAYNLGGAISFAFSDTDDLDNEATTKDILITPSFTYFVSDNISLGANLQFEYRETSTRNAASNQVLSRSINKFLVIGPTGRYYFHTRNFTPFIETSLGYTTFLTSNDHGIAITLGIGINYFITSNIALEPHVIYTMSKFFAPDYRVNRYTFGVRIFYQINN